MKFMNDNAASWMNERQENVVWLNEMAAINSGINQLIQSNSLAGNEFWFH